MSEKAQDSSNQQVLAPPQQHNHTDSMESTDSNIRYAAYASRLRVCKFFAFFFSMI